MDILVALFGRFHPMLVHFPIALLIVVTAQRGAALVLRRPSLNQGSSWLVYLAAASALVSAGAGLALASGDTWHGRSADRLDLHRWLTLAATAAAVVAAVLERVRRPQEHDVINTAFLVLSTGLVAAGAHLGGTLVFGEDHFSSAFETRADAVAEGDKKKDEPKKEEPKKDEPKAAPEEKKAEAKVDFKKEIWPILDKSCIKCHGAKKQKGELRLDRKADAFKGGESEEPSVVPGKSAESRLYKLITLPEDDEDFMPAKGDPLTKAQRELIRRWIDEGAHWPE